MSVGTVPEPDPTDRACAALIWELHHASANELEHAVFQAREYARCYSYDEEILKALELAERRFAAPIID